MHLSVTNFRGAPGPLKEWVRGRPNLLRRWGTLRSDVTSRESIRHAVACGLPPVRLHDMRHGACSLLLPGGGPIEIVQMILGHSSSAAHPEGHAHLLRMASAQQVEAAVKVLTGQGREQRLESTCPIRRRKRLRLGHLVRREGIEPPTR
jgi:hypothetical protein